MRDAVYDHVLSFGEEGAESFRRELRRAGIAPTPAEKKGNLYAPNPVVVPRRIVDAMMADLNRFCEARREETTGPGDLVATMPDDLRATFAGPEVAEALFERLGREHPISCLDAYLVERDGVLEPAYLEWQTHPAYHATALVVLEAIRRAYPGLEDVGAAFSPRPGEDLDGLRERLRGYLLSVAPGDARECVLVDYRPREQDTFHEFHFEIELTGGAERGYGVIDPREIVWIEGRPHSRRGERTVPIRHAFSRLVHGDMVRLRDELGAEERASVARFFGGASGVDWLVHPLHFAYGTKGDFPRFGERGLTARIPRCRPVTAALIAEARAAGPERLTGLVQKPVEGCGGQGVVLEPRPDQLVPGAILQDLIRPAACHRTLAGDRTPEVRVMGLPTTRGDLDCASVFTRVRAPEAFGSNAGIVARAGVPGTGEGYAVLVP
ncbi:MAG: hypothetical protein R3F20_17240 [Planctomycetota bacterium]